MSAENPQIPQEFKVRIVHVFLGRSSSGAIKINVVAPDHTEIDEIACSVTAPPFTAVSRTAKFKNDIVRLYQFEFDNLIHGQKYSYKFTANGKPLDLGGGLRDEHLFFEYWDELTEADSLIHMSCNGVFFFKDEAERWDMWHRLHSDLESEQLNPKLLVLGGDQYYQDEVEFDWFDKLGGENFENIKADFIRASMRNALNHWSDISYRKVMARIPSVAMLDDHDLTDGANGDRKKLYVGETNEFNEKWNRFVSVQTELFSLLQASRNPAPLYEVPNKAFTFILDLGETALVALDLRTEKNARKKTLMSENAQKVLFTALKQLKNKHVMILIPVVPVKNSQALEGTVLAMTKLASSFLETFKPKTALEQKLQKGTSFIADLEDDLTDALCSDANKDFLFDLLNLLLDKAKDGVSFSILSGDIHTAGTVELHLKRGSQYVVIPILVSSPIGYEPMNFLVEASLREKKEIKINHKGIELNAVNHAFTTNRNFMEVYPVKLIISPNQAVRISEEGIRGSKSVLISGWRTGENHQITNKAAILAAQTLSIQTQKT